MTAPEDLRKAEKIFPVSLLLSGKRCLVVGGGRVADRKVRQLLESDAEVTIISPELGPGLSELLRVPERPRAIRHIVRGFRTGDTAGFLVVFAATDDLAANRAVLSDARAHGVLCGNVDFGWREGDLISPAVSRAHGLTVAVGTGGRSCRRARMVKESIGRHLDAMGNVGLLVLGASHEQLPLARREELRRTMGGAETASRLLRQVWGVHEFLLLETCNRVELLAVADQGEECLELLRRLLGFDRLRPEEYYLRLGADAFRHSALLCAGLLSQVAGEGHVTGQLKDALDAARAAGSSGAALEDWIATALRVSKEIRRGLAADLLPREAEDVAAEFIAESAPRAARFAVIGTGVTGLGVLRRLLADHPAATADWCWFRTKPETPPWAEGRMELQPVAGLDAALARADVIVCAAGGVEPVLQTSHAPCLAGRDVLVLDLAMPRNVEPALAAAVPELRLVDLDGLKAWDRRRRADAARLREAGDAIVENHRELYDHLLLHIQGWNEGQ
jgi:glutamyl-tRNA reductase